MAALAVQMRALLVAVVSCVAAVTAHAEPCAPVRATSPHAGRIDLELTSGATIQRDLALSASALVWSSGEALWRIQGDGRGCLEQLARRPDDRASLVDS